MLLYHFERPQIFIITMDSDGFNNDEIMQQTNMDATCVIYRQ